ncbi:hypothetical protein [Nocardia camponoti]|uniref:Uncharacterized protein n=1 Tax=Nocardia camponoti TaxID=1616106 RepID=A0A917QIW9_9NOCA|nr:hypothetical protein [Nocardia camponoti]GGK52791.1 hypothetical protein GCM10011591_25680 [Nocardia camponoti]
MRPVAIDEFVVDASALGATPHLPLQTDSARTELAPQRRLALTNHPSFEVRVVGRDELHVARPYDHNQERTPYLFTLALKVIQYYWWQ